MAPISIISRLGLLSTMIFTLAVADRMCHMNEFGCATPFPPGHQNMGPGWWAVGTWDFGTYIKSVQTLLQVPDLPQGVDGIMVINPAMENTPVKDWSDAHVAEQTTQTLVGSFMYNFCNNGPVPQWCAFTSFFDKKLNPTQHSGANASVYKGEWIQINYDFTPGTGTENGQATAGYVEQTLTINGQQVSYLKTTVTEQPYQFFPKTECQCGASGNFPGHIYHNTEITLGSKQPNWLDSCINSQATDSGAYTQDGGLTWKWDTIWMGGGVCINNSETCTGQNT